MPQTAILHETESDITFLKLKNGADLRKFLLLFAVEAPAD